MFGLREEEVDLGAVSSFTKFPVPIRLGNCSFFLVHGKKGYALLSTICPHQGGRVSDQGSGFFCRDHCWRFEYTQGECINGPRVRMISYPVTVRLGHLIADFT